MNTNNTDTLPGFEKLVAPFKFRPTPYEYKVVPLREAPTPENMQLCDTPDAAAQYWRLHVPSKSALEPGGHADWLRRLRQTESAECWKLLHKIFLGHF